MKNSLANTIRRMKLFEFIPITTLTTSNGITTEGNCINYYFPEDEKVMRLFEPVLGKHGTSPVFFFKGPPPVPWALVCFDKEYPFARHVMDCRSVGSGIYITPYSTPPSPEPIKYIPDVGILQLESKKGLHSDSERSPLFQLIEESLSGCPSNKHWLVFFGSLHDSLVEMISDS